jgi:Tol biopolymer transport system component
MSASDDGSKIVTNRYERQSNIVITDENGNGGASLQLYACCPDTVSWISEDEIVFDAFADGKRSLWTMLVDGTGQKKLFSTDAQDWAPDASHDGQSIVFLSTRSGSRQIWMSQSDGPKPQQLTRLAVDVDSPRYSSDGSYIYFSMLVEGKWMVARIHAEGGDPETVVDRNTGVWDVSPDGKSIAYSFWPEDADHQNIAVADTDTRNIRYRFDVSSKYLLRWTPDGRQLISEDPAPENTSLQVLSRQNVTPDMTRTTLGKSALVNYFVAVSPGTHKYAFVRGHLISSAAMLVRK